MKPPKPNEHGVYPEESARSISITCKKFHATVRYLNIAPGQWISSHCYSCGWHGSSSPLTTDTTHETAADAILKCLRRILAISHSDIHNPNCPTKTSIRDARKIHEWAQARITALETPPKTAYQIQARRRLEQPA